MGNDLTRLDVPTRTLFPAGPQQRPQPERLQRTIRGPARLGWALVFAFAAGFGGWAGTVPLAAGAVAPGIVSPDGSRRTVQHLEGGLIAEILARDGDYVEKDQPVLLLGSVQAAAVFDELQNEYHTLLATRARLTAELLGRPAITFPDELTQQPNTPATVDVIAGQRAIFESRKEVLAAQKRVLHERLAQSDEQVHALQAQIDSATAQLDLLATEIEDKQALLADALTTRPQLLALQRQHAEMEGQRGEFAATIAEIGQKRGEIESQLLSLDAERTDNIATELDTTRASLAGVTERLNSSRDILERTVVRAPVSGYVVNSKFKSVGGVVIRGEKIMDIVPAEERLLIDARVNIVDIDVVRPGLPATIRLTALDYYRLPRIEGVVLSVSADRIVDEVTGQAYYLARVEVPRDVLGQAGVNAELVPGMPAEVLIVTTERTMFDYLLQPFRSAFERSFHET